MKRLAIIGQHVSSAAAAESKQRVVASNATAGIRDLETAAYPTLAADYFNFDDLLTPELVELRKRIRNFMEKEIAPIVTEYWEKGVFPREVMVAKMKKLGLAGMGLKGYGCPDYGHMGAAILMLEMARVDPSTSTFLTVHTGLAMNSIYLCGSEEQKNKYLPAMAKLDLIGCFGLTESEYGSDASSLETTARYDPARKGYILNGNKRWIGNGCFADVVIIWARNTETGGVNGFIVKKGTPGMSATKIMNKTALRIVENADIYLKDVFVPECEKLAHADTFSNGVGRVLASSRIFVAWKPVGLSMGVYDNCLRYIKQRRQFGTPLASFQLVQEKLVRMLGNIQAMVLLAWRLSQMYEKGTMTDGQSSMAKAWNTLRGREVASLGRELMGGNGIVLDYHVARLFADMEAIYTYEGTYEINTLVCGREVTGAAAIKAAGAAPQHQQAKKKK